MQRASEDKAEPTSDEASEDAEAAIARRREVDDLKWLMGHPQGRRIVTRLLEMTHVYKPSFTPNGSVMCFKEGERNVGLWLTGELMETTPDEYLKLLRDYQSK